MVDTLRESGITNQRVLDAMNEVPRHFFVPMGLDVAAYDEDPLRIGFEQTISRPSTVANQSQLLMLEKGMRVLEIGTGSGYQTAVLCRMGAIVYSIERQKGLFNRTRSLLRQLGYPAHCYLGDGYQGLTEVNIGLFDRVLITCGAPYIPEALMRQLKVGGIMVIPVGEGEQEMLRITKEGENKEEWKVERFGKFNFVPMLDGRAM